MSGIGEANPLKTLQHERDFDQNEAWRRAWERCADDDGARAQMLVMLKQRRDAGSVEAGTMLQQFAREWLE